MEAILNLVLWLVIGGIVGWAAGQFMGGTGFGTIGDIIVGIVGSYVGAFILQLIPGVAGVSFNEGLSIGSLLTAFFGAVVLIFVVRLIKNRG
jgi:uncharacterized membrane protein YeaQ/YmgE (transglycosylase-associated protein family)